MVKRQKEKQYESSIEHKLNSQIRSGRSNNNNQPRPLPFNCCALTLTPFANPVCCILSNTTAATNTTTITTSSDGKRKIEKHGILFENSEIIPYLLKHRKNPIDGSDMSSQSLITLQMDKNEDNLNNDNGSHTTQSTGKTWQCPILNKPFMNHTKIVAIRTPSGGNNANVYSYEAVHTLNFKPKNYTDLISGTKFNPKKDVILLNDPHDPTLLKWRDISHFVHLQTLRDANQNHGRKNQNENIQLSISAKRVMDKFNMEQQEKDKIELKRKQKKEQKRKEDEEKEMEKKKYLRQYYYQNLQSKNIKILTSDLGITYTKGQISGSFTSSSLSSSHNTSSSKSSFHDIREATEEEILSSLFTKMKKRKKKGFVRMYTNMGHMDIELHCHITPRTCMNFIGLIENQYYDGTYFHRLIRNFMVQGGGINTTTKQQKQKKRKKRNEEEDDDDDTKRIKEEQSIWGKPFEDEFDQRLKHVGPGILSMANAGSNTNKCQFFITFKSAPHLDRKHSIFGKVIKGMDVLSQIETSFSTDKNDRPLEDLYIEKMVLFGDNPVKDAEELEERMVLKRMADREKDKADRLESALGKSKYDGKNGIVTAKQANLAAGVVVDSDQVSSVPKVGRYLQKAIKKMKKTSSKLKSSGCVDEKDDTSTTTTLKDDNDNFPAIPSRLPPPPKKTTFSDFSGW